MDTHYERRKFFNKMKSQNFRSGEQVSPVKYDFDSLPRNGYIELPTDKDKEILDEMLTTFQEFYGITLEQMMSRKQYHWQAIIRQHFFWFVDLYKERSKYDNEPFNPTDRFVAAMFGKVHAMFKYGKKTIDLLLQTEPQLRGTHEDLCDLLEERLDRFELG